MSRIISNSKALSVNLGPVERVLVAYYARRFGGSKGTIIRGMIRKIAENDESFDAADFVKFAHKDFAAADNVEEAEAGLIAMAAGQFAQTLKTKR